MQSPQRRSAQPRYKPLAMLNGALLLGLLLTCNVAMAQWDFERIIQTAEHQYGALHHLNKPPKAQSNDRLNTPSNNQTYGQSGSAHARIEAWQQLLRTHRNRPEREQLNAVNHFFNRELRFLDDTQVWQQADYWATPLEALVQGAGDCEDYALAKYFSLRYLGVPRDKLRITYAKVLNYDRAHMVLSYYRSPTAEPLVLDNLFEQIRPAAQRPDLLPIFAFNAEGLYPSGGGPRSADSTQFARWQDLLGKMRAEGFSRIKDQ